MGKSEVTLCGFNLHISLCPVKLRPNADLDVLILESSTVDHKQRRTKIGRTSLNEWSARRRDLYLTKHNNHKRQTFMPPAGFRHNIPASERP